MAKKQPVPEFLQHIHIALRDEAELTPVLTNWLKTHRYLMNLPIDAHEQVGKLLLLELASPTPRLSMVDRLSSRYNRMRALAFHNQISAYMDRHA